MDVPYGGAEAGHRPPLLQVGFSVQVGRLNVANTVGVWCVQEEEVCRDDAIAGHLHKISHSHVLPPPFHKAFLPTGTRNKAAWVAPYTHSTSHLVLSSLSIYTIKWIIFLFKPKKTRCSGSKPSAAVFVRLCVKGLFRMRKLHSREYSEREGLWMNLAEDWKLPGRLRVLWFEPARQAGWAPNDRSCRYAALHVGPDLTSDTHNTTPRPRQSQETGGWCILSMCILTHAYIFSWQ